MCRPLELYRKARTRRRRVGKLPSRSARACSDPPRAGRAWRGNFAYFSEKGVRYRARGRGIVLLRVGCMGEARCEEQVEHVQFVDAQGAALEARDHTYLAVRNRFDIRELALYRER